MKNWKNFALCAACLASLAFAMPDFAEAARIGKGRSFGSSSIMSRPATPPSGAFKSGSSSVNRQAPMASSRADGGATTMPRNNTGMLGGFSGAFWQEPCWALSLVATEWLGPAGGCWVDS